MTALSANKVTPRQEGDIISLPVYQSTTIYAGGFVSVVTSHGYAVPTANAANHRFKGIALDYVDNSAGSSGDKEVRLWTTGDFEIVTSGMAITDNGAKMYAADDQKATKATTTHNVYVGKVQRYISATRNVISIDEAAKAGA